MVNVNPCQPRFSLKEFPGNEGNHWIMLNNWQFIRNFLLSDRWKLNFMDFLSGEE